MVEKKASCVDIGQHVSATYPVAGSPANPLPYFYLQRIIPNLHFPLTRTPLLQPGQIHSFYMSTSFPTSRLVISIAPSSIPSHYYLGSGFLPAILGIGGTIGWTCAKSHLSNGFSWLLYSEQFLQQHWHSTELCENYAWLTNEHKSVPFFNMVPSTARCLKLLLKFTKISNDDCIE